jgi:MoxR-like ATPase
MPKKDLTPKDFDIAVKQMAQLSREIKKIVYGQDHVIDLILTSLLSNGHTLLMGVPGLAKTLLAQTLATIISVKASRIQCTPDLMPSDIIGAEVLEEDLKGKRNFRFIKGPVFTNILLVDEINRASPRTQSALLQAMQEREVSMAGLTHTLETPFHVIATQNPIEQDGTYPLPEAQLDRFMMQIKIDYPDLKAEKEMLKATTTGELPKATAQLKKADLLTAQEIVLNMPIGEKVIDAILTLVRNLRPSESDDKDIQNYVTWAPGPRASQALSIASRAYALIHGRETPSIDDVIAIAVPVLEHRMALNFLAETENVTKEKLIQQLCKTL